MTIDARDKAHPETLKQIRKHFAANCNGHVDLQVLVQTHAYAMIINDIASMTKYDLNIEKNDGHFIINISGNSCACS